MTIELNYWEAKLALEAMQALDTQWKAVIRGTEDEDVQSDYGNDLAQLRLVRERLATAACEEFGPGVQEFSREPIAANPKG